MPQAVLRLPTQPNINQSYSSALLGNFYKLKGTILLFRLQLDLLVGAHMLSVPQGFNSSDQKWTSD